MCSFVFVYHKNINCTRSRILAIFLFHCILSIQPVPETQQVLNQHLENKGMNEQVYQGATITMMLHNKLSQNSEAYNKKLFLLNHNPDTWDLPLRDSNLNGLVATWTYRFFSLNFPGGSYVQQCQRTSILDDICYYSNRLYQSFNLLNYSAII